MRCPACDTSIDVAGVFPGGGVRFPTCGIDARVPAPMPNERSPYRAAESRAHAGPEPIACPMCAGHVAPLARVCPHCDVKLDSVRCSHCFAMQMTGERKCTRCGRELELEPLLDPTDAPCPSCDRLLEAVPGSPEGIHECPGCSGLFVDHPTLARITVEREAAGPLLSTRPFEVPRVQHVETAIRYVKCPLCHQAMNRANFGRKSGVIVDVCKQHGTWFDAGELTSAIAFVSNGGLEGTRRRGREDAEQAARDQSAAVAVHAAMIHESMNETNRDARRVAMTLDFVENVVWTLFHW